MNRNYDVSDAVKNYMMQYSKSVITDRAIVSLEDGLKPSQRLELWALYSNNVTHKSKRIKGLTATGEALKYVPHGDNAVFETMARMAQEDTFLYPLIDGKGNMGQHTGRDVSPAAPRYVEMRLTEFAEELFKNIDKNAVDFVNNFDNTKKQPVVLPAPFPSILTLGSSGIAVGFASSIPSFNLVEVCQYTINVIQGKENSYLVPDFATGGKIIYNESELRKIEDEGKGKVTLRGTYHVQDNIIIIDSIPFSTTRETIIEKIVDLVKQGKLKEIKDVRDGTDKDGMSIEIDIKNGTDVEKLMAKLYKLTPLQSDFSCNMNVIYNNKPIRMGVKQIIDAWIDFRRNTIKRIAQYELNKTQKNLNYLYALEKVLLDIDKAIAIIKKSKNDEETIKNLMKGFDIGKEEAETVANFKLRNLNESYINNKIKDIESVEKTIKTLKNMINSEKLIDNYIVKDLQRIMKKYDKPRQTEIIYDDEFSQVLDDVVEEIDDYNVRVFITKEGYIKKIPLTSLRGNFTIKVKDGDEIINEIDTTNNSDILVFTNKKNVYKYKTYDLEDHKPSVLGEYLPTLLNLKDEDILFVTVTNDYKGFLIVGFEDGKVAKIELSAYQTKQNRSMLKNAYADKKALFFKHIDEDIDVLALSSIGKALVFNTSMINPKSSKTTIGVQIMKSKNDSVVDSYYSLDDAEYEEVEYYRVVNAGIGKYLRNEDFSTKIPLDKRKK